MLRAMDSAVAGLRAHQNKLDVISNNIANVNTFGFKSMVYSFKEAMYQTSSNSTGGVAGGEGTTTAAGTNGAQYGFGTMMGSISMDMTASTPSYVGIECQHQRKRLFHNESDCYAGCRSDRGCGCKHNNNEAEWIFLYQSRKVPVG